MQALIDQVLDLLRGGWRFRWQAMLAAWGVCLAGWLVVLSMPDMYESNARVFVDTRTPLTPVIQGIAIGQDVDAQLNFVQQSLLSGPQLLTVAREAGMEMPGMTTEARASMVNSLRERVTLTAKGPERGVPGGTIYTINFQDGNRDRALKVVDTLLNTFVEDTLGGKKQGTAQAQKFLEQQIQDYERRLGEAEQRLSDFKRRNVGLMPGAGTDYFSSLQAAIDTEKRAQGTLAVALTRRAEIERQLRGEAPFAAGGANASGGEGSQDTGARIKETEARLDELLLRFTERHPDVVATQETLNELKRRRAAEIEALRRGDRSAAGSGASANPVYQNIQLALNKVDVEIAALRREIADHQEKIAGLRRMIDTAPEVEAEFARLNRDYDITKSQYGTLVERLEKARIGEDAEATGSVRFEIIDPPNADFQPVAPNRLALVALVLLVGIGAAGGLIYLMQQLKPVFNNSRVLSDLTGLPVLGVVSMTWLDRHKSELRRSYVLYAGAGAALVVVFALTASFNAPGAAMLRQILGASTGST
jgi:polysaccharide chain length determinant protein (PEP-CTERM system associated)